MTQRGKRTALLTLLLSITMVLTIIPAMVWADTEPEKNDGDSPLTASLMASISTDSVKDGDYYIVTAMVKDSDQNVHYYALSKLSVKTGNNLTMEKPLDVEWDSANSVIKYNPSDLQELVWAGKHNTSTSGGSTVDHYYLVNMDYPSGYRPSGSTSNNQNMMYITSGAKGGVKYQGTFNNTYNDNMRDASYDPVNNDLYGKSSNGNSHVILNTDNEGKAVKFTTASSSNKNIYLFKVSCKVTFDLNNHGTGDAPEAQTLTWGSKVTEPAAPADSSLTFGGWYDNPQCTGSEFDFTKEVKTNQTLYAKWVQMHTVTFNMKGHGTAISSQPVADGEKVVKPSPDPSEEGWHFDGWYADSDCTIAFNFENSEITADAELFAKWRQLYKVEFDLNGKAAAKPADQMVPEGDSASIPTTEPTNDEYDFGGWYENSACTGSAYDFTTAVMTNKTLYAKWTPKPTYTIGFNLNGIGSADQKPEDQTVVRGGKVNVVTAPTADGFTFGGWYTTSACTGDAYNFNTSVDGSFTLYAKWTDSDSYFEEVEPNTEGVFTLEGGKMYLIASGSDAELYALSDKVVRVVGESNDRIGTRIPITDYYSNGAVVLPANLTDHNVPTSRYVGIWACSILGTNEYGLVNTNNQSFYITADSKGGIKYQSGKAVSFAEKRRIYGLTSNPQQDSSKYYITFADKVLESGEPAESIFTTNTNEPDNAIEIRLFKQAEGYVVTFDMNGHGTQENPQKVINGEYASKPSTDPTEEGWDFGGWFTDKDCTADKEFSFETPITADMKIYAKWTEKPAPTPPTPGPDPKPGPQPTPDVGPSAAAPVEYYDLPVVKISKPKTAKKKVTVKWKKVSKKNLKKIKGIQIQVATDQNFTNIVKTATAGKKKTSKVVKGLQPKTKYYVRIRAYADGNHFSNWRVKSVKVK